MSTDNPRLTVGANQSGSERAGVDARPLVRVKPMQLSDGRTDYFVSIQVGEREVTPHVFREEYKAAYHVALYDWLLNGSGEEPDVVEFGPDDWPALATPPAQPAPAAPHGKPDGAERACTCHPSDNPPVPCAQKFAYSECVGAAAETSPGDVLDVLRSIRAMCDEPLSYGRSNLADRIAAAIDRLDVKAEAKSQEPNAVAIKPLEWYEEPLRSSDNPAWNADSPVGTYRVFKAWRGKEKKAGWIGNGEFHNTEAEAKAAAQADYERRIRSAFAHPTTKPEAPAVSVDAIRAALRPFIGHDTLGVKVQGAARVVAALIAEGR